MPRPRKPISGHPEQIVRTSVSMKRRTLRKGIEQAQVRKRTLSNYLADRIEDDVAPKEPVSLRP